MTWLWVLLAFCAGGILGVMVMCCLFVAREEDEQMKKYNTQDAERK